MRTEGRLVFIGRTAIALGIYLGSGCISPGNTSESEQDSTIEPGAISQESRTPSELRDVLAEADAIATSDDITEGAEPRAFAGVCNTGKGNTAGWADCTGTGTVRLVIDCTFPQIPDFVGSWVTFTGSVTLRGECAFGINRVFVQVQ